jgi:hypothetical protein
MANFPISAPGKNRGSTTNESVVKARFSEDMVHNAESLSLLRISLSKARKKRSLIRRRLWVPPLPWLIKIVLFA